MSFAEEWDEIPLPPLTRQMSFMQQPGASWAQRDVLYPGASWADLAEDDPEMQLMGPPTTVPPGIDPAWITPKKTARRTGPVPIEAFLTPQNRYTMLHRLEEPTAASLVAAHPALSPSSPVGGHRSAPLSAPSTAETEARQTPPPSPRTD